MMKNIMRTPILIALILNMFNCTANKNIMHSNTKANDSIIVGKKVVQYFGEDLTQFIVKSDSVMYNIIEVVQMKDSTNNKYTVNKLKKIRLLNNYHKEILKFVIFSDSTYIWSKTKIKQSFEPELSFTFMSDSLKTNVVYSPNTKQFGVRFKDFFNIIRIRKNPLFDDLLNKIKITYTKEKDSINEVIIPKNNDSIKKTK